MSPRPVPKMRPWWTFRSLKALRQDRAHYRAFLARFNADQALVGLRPVRYPSWFVRHKIISTVVGIPAALFVLIFAVAVGAVIADPHALEAGPVSASPVDSAATPTAQSSTSSSPSPSPTTPSPTSTGTDSAAAERARQEREAADRAAQKKKAAAQKKAAAKKKAAAERAAAEKKAAAKKKAAARRAAQRRQREQAARDRRDTFPNCTAMNKRYPHGVGRPGARDQTSGTRVRNFTVSTRIYDLNAGSDRDDDGIACEKL